MTASIAGPDGSWRTLLARLPVLLMLGAAFLLAGCATGRNSDADRPPIVFVHGNGDSGALWQTTVWRFESNGWPREAARNRPPLPARTGRRPSAQAGSYLDRRAHGIPEGGGRRGAARTGAEKVILVGNSRGGNAIRNYIQNGGGEHRQAMRSSPARRTTASGPIKGMRENSEFSGPGPS